MDNIDKARDLLLKKDGGCVRATLQRRTNADTGKPEIVMLIMKDELKKALMVRTKLFGARPHHVSAIDLFGMDRNWRAIHMTQAPENVRALIKILNYLNIEVIVFHPAFYDELPPTESRGVIFENAKCFFAGSGFSDEQIEEALGYLTLYHWTYYEDTTKRKTYHRACRGGSMIETEGRLYCSRCGVIQYPQMPDFFRQAMIAGVKQHPQLR